MSPWMNCLRASRLPWVSRLSTRSQSRSRARWQVATVRMAWWTRPPPSRVWAMTKACPSPPRRLSAGTRTSS